MDPKVHQKGRLNACVGIIAEDTIVGRGWIRALFPRDRFNLLNGYRADVLEWGRSLTMARMCALKNRMEFCCLGGCSSWRSFPGSGCEWGLLNINSLKGFGVCEHDGKYMRAGNWNQ